MDERILTLHPHPDKQGVRISKTHYDVMRKAVVEAFQANGEMTFTELNQAVHDQLDGSFDGSISWYAITVKLDLEARGVVQRVPGTRPQRLRLAAS